MHIQHTTHMNSIHTTHMYTAKRILSLLTVHRPLFLSSPEHYSVTTIHIAFAMWYRFPAS